MKKLAIFVVALALVRCSSAIIDGPIAEQAARDSASQLGLQSRVVSIPAGRIVGQQADGVATYFGIPYAWVPARFESPQPIPRRGLGSFQANEHGPLCLQWKNDGTSIDFDELVGVESPPSKIYSVTNPNCLTVSIYAPAKITRPAKVMVFIPGGGFVVGGVTQETKGRLVYDGSEFARRGIVLVVFNYRVGVQGWFYHPALPRDPQGAMGNYGYRDQVAALKWVKENIGAFGGDPEQVTIFGESGGGRSVLTHTYSPHSKGYFNSAIMESANYLGFQSETEARTESIRETESLCPFDTARAGDATYLRRVLGCLRRIPPETLTNLGRRSTPGVPTRYFVVDGINVPDFPVRAYRRGIQHKNVPLLFVSNRNEHLNLISPILFGGIDGGQYLRLASDFLGKFFSDGDVRRVLQRYEGYCDESDAHCAPPILGVSTYYLQLEAMNTDFRYNCLQQILMKEAARTHAAPIYKGLFSYGIAVHGAELQYVYGVPSTNSFFTRPQRELSREMQDAWISFASGGSVMVAGQLWPTWSEAGTTTVQFGMGWDYRTSLRGEYAICGELWDDVLTRSEVAF